MKQTHRRRSSQMSRNHRKPRIKQEKEIKFRYHRKKIIFPLLILICIIVATFFLFLIFGLPDHIDFWVTKNQYLLYIAIALLNIAAIIFLLLKIKEYFSLSLVLEKNTLQVITFIEFEIELSTIVEVYVFPSLLGNILGYASIKIVTENKSVYNYTNIAKAKKLAKAIRLIQKKSKNSTTNPYKDDIFSRMLHR